MNGGVLLFTSSAVTPEMDLVWKKKFRYSSHETRPNQENETTIQYLKYDIPRERNYWSNIKCKYLSSANKSSYNAIYSGSQ